MKTEVVVLERRFNARERTFAELGADRVAMYMGEYTNVVGDFFDKKTLVVTNPDLTSMVTVYTREEKALVEAHNSFGKFFNVGNITWMGAGNFGFRFSVADLTAEDYSDLLEKTYHFLTLTSR